MVWSACGTSRDWPTAMKTGVIGRQLFDDIGTNRHLSCVAVTLRGLIVALATHWPRWRQKGTALAATRHVLWALTKNACAAGARLQTHFCAFRVGEMQMSCSDATVSHQHDSQSLYHTLPYARCVLVAAENDQRAHMFMEPLSVPARDN